ncbi:HemK2/MTQ2 family protein methyltransferase [Kutzneria kofuensis]|uniref:Release factor glutamine methyltransferase n=1 Tax=Kutzneria kofuensis TaxID=103725 RepID=A0A7W9KRK1_9PSEU|nr:HemK2/MTQ2 family protein methyltransferase [Kutzneria kofuensis]MBB5897123.1 release factor glutamine methyltransferase [Kutzneria kofuensis]
MTTFEERLVPSPALRLFRSPGVYRPQSDTWLLAEAAAAARIPPGARVLDICTGTGALAITASMLGARHVVAIDVSRRAVLSARLNAWLNGQRITALRGSMLALPAKASFDVVLANPPYVPCPADTVTRGRRRAWNAGKDGRALLDPICRSMPQLLKPNGFLLMVHSALSDTDKSLRQLREGGLRADVVLTSTIPFGPVMRSRTEFLEQEGLIEPGQRHEDLVVIRADRP